jgi:hypothetical protein
MNYQSNDIAIAILTVNRQPQYIHQTLASLFAADPTVHHVDHISIMVGSDDASYLSRYDHHKKFRIATLSSPESEKLKSWRVQQRFNHNYYRCLSIPLDGKRGIIVCEDDIIFRDSFLVRLLDTIHEMEIIHNLSDYALAIFSAYDFENDQSFYRGKLYCSYGYEFYGTPCMYYPSKTARLLADFIKSHGVDVYEEPGDMLVKRLYGEKMYACSRSLAQHVGEISTGLGGGGGTPSFGRCYRPIMREEWGTKV